MLVNSPDREIEQYCMSIHEIIDIIQNEDNKTENSDLISHNVAENASNYDILNVVAHVLCFFSSFLLSSPAVWENSPEILLSGGRNEIENRCTPHPMR